MASQWADDMSQLICHEEVIALCNFKMVEFCKLGTILYLNWTWRLLRSVWFQNSKLATPSMCTYWGGADRYSKRSLFRKFLYQKVFIPIFFFILNSNFSDTKVYGSSSLGTVLFRRIIIPKIFIPNSLFSNSRYPERSLFSVKVVNTVLSIIQAEKAEQIVWPSPCKALWHVQVAVQRLVKYWQFRAVCWPGTPALILIKNTFSAEFEMASSLILCPKQICRTINVIIFKPIPFKTSHF